MKKLFLGLAAFALIGTFASCKKDYTCSCTFDTTTGITAEMSKFNTGKMSKSDAEKTCSDAQSVWSALGAKCSLD